MKTITFYSYKGGVGRSLALSKIAARLSELNKKVCVLDFDLDAPGLQFKFKSYLLEKRIEKGIVDYIYNFSSNAEVGNIRDFAVNLSPTNDAYANICFIPAGDIECNEYWKRLSQIRWADMFYGDEPQGVSFFLDLKAKIEREFNPDYFLIDSRTGITDISGITLRLLADQVVVLAVNNKENIFGSKKIIKNLQAKSFPKNPLKINFVLTRMPYTPKEIELENKVLENLREEFQAELDISGFQISVIHSDVALKMEDSYFAGKKMEEQTDPLHKDYIKLFELITEGSLVNDEYIQKIKEAELEFAKYFSETSNEEQRLKHLDRAIALNPTNYVYFAHRGVQYFKMRETHKAIEDYKHAIRLNPQDSVLPYNMGHFYKALGEYVQSLEYLDRASSYGEKTFYLKAEILEKMGRTDEAIEAINEALDINPLNDGALNLRANLLRAKGEFAQAFIDVSKAIETNPAQPVYFGTLAELYADQGKLDEFYLNLSIALSKGLNANNLRSAKDVYVRFKDDKRFLDLMTKYNLFVDDIIS